MTPSTAEAPKAGNHAANRKPERKGRSSLRRAQRKLRDRLAAALAIMEENVRSWGWPDPAERGPSLLPLAPAYEPDKHSLYVGLIEDALTQGHRGVHNIALSGGYGVGKSSILSEIARRHRGDVLTISLSSLGLAEHDAVSTADGLESESSKTNRIQKEIVKQLLYSERPGKMPGSSYRRATRLPVLRIAAYSVLVGVVVGTVFLLTGWGAQAAKSLGIAADVWATTLAVALLAAVVVSPLLSLFHHRLQLTAVEAGGATISLSAKSATYFDEYLDEIVYFFEVVKRDIVIFEDIDRFNDPHIFETLRSLNAILNGAKQLRGRRVRFIYAIKDSIFDRLGELSADAAGDVGKDAQAGGVITRGEPEPRDTKAVESEAARANRTKFFEIVIPVVPFVTHRSGRDLLLETLGDLRADISTELIDLAGKHVADMRLIKNIRNEYAVFKRQVLSASKLELDEDHLFAMMLYKSTQLGDFELIRLGESALDELYRASRDFVSSALASIDDQLRAKRRHKREGTITEAQAESLGVALDRYVERVLRHTPSNLGVRRAPRLLKIDDRVLDADETTTPEFWRRFTEEAVALTVVVQRSNGTQFEFEFSRDDLELALHAPLGHIGAPAKVRQALDAEIADLEGKRAQIVGADMSELTRIHVHYGETESGSRRFDEIVEEKLKSPLARELLRAGYIDRNFTLYTSPYYTVRLSEAAANFLMKSVDPNRPDRYAKLTPNDVKLLLQERGVGFLTSPAGLNLSVLDYLLETNDPNVGSVVKYLLSTGQEGRSFMLSYFQAGAAPGKLVTVLTPQWEQIIQFLVTSADVEEGPRSQLMDAALQALAPTLTYAVNDEVAGELSGAYKRLQAFTSDAIPESTASALADLVSRAGTEIGDLSPLGLHVKRAVVKKGAYRVDRRNLESALNGAGGGLSLDVIKEADRLVYKHVLKNVEAYLASLASIEVTVQSASSFSSVVADLAARSPENLGEVVGRAAAECIIEDLEAVEDHTVAPMLARANRFAPSLHNITAYLAWSEGIVDEHLVPLLARAEAITGVAEAEEDEKRSLAVVLARTQGLTPEKRASLIESLELEYFLDPADLDAEEGDLFPVLMQRRVVEDDADTYGRLSGTSWVTREGYIAVSSEFKNFATPELVGADLALLLRSSRIPGETKQAILAEADAYAASASAVGVQALAEQASITGAPISLNTLRQFVRVGVPAERILVVLAPLLPGLGMTELSPLLSELGGEYAKLAGATGKRPLIPKSAASEALIARLSALGVVSSFTRLPSDLRVRMRMS